MTHTTKLLINCIAVRQRSLARDINPVESRRCSMLPAYFVCKCGEVKFRPFCSNKVKNTCTISITPRFNRWNAEWMFQKLVDYFVFHSVDNCHKCSTNRRNFWGSSEIFQWFSFLPDCFHSDVRTEQTRSSSRQNKFDVQNDLQRKQQLPLMVGPCHSICYFHSKQVDVCFHTAAALMTLPFHSG